MSYTDELSQLSELHRNGDLTDDEFAAAKKKLLGLSAPVISDQEEENYSTEEEDANVSGSEDASEIYAKLLEDKSIASYNEKEKGGTGATVAKGCGIGCLGLIALIVIVLLLDHTSSSTESAATPAPSTNEPSKTLNDEKFDVYFAAETIVSQYLKSPSSAEFPNWRGAAMVQNSDGSWTIYSAFEGTNSFGGKLQSHFKITMRKGANGWEAVAPPWIEDVN